MSYFDELGEMIDRMWLDADRDEESFPSLAQEALTQYPIVETFDRHAFLRTQLNPFVAARHDRAPLGAFGQPGITVYFGRGFVIEVYFWVQSLAGVHDHPFRGLFTILDGFSVHAQHTFTPALDTNLRFRVGHLRCTQIEVLKKGDSRLFSHTRHPLIHTLLHVPRGAISMVIRTVQTQGYYQYFPPHFAVRHEEPDPVIARQLYLLEGLRLSGDPTFGDHLREYLLCSDLPTCLSALSPFWARISNATRKALLATIQERHDEQTAELDAVLERTSREQNANAYRQQLRDDDDRFVVTVLLCAENRGQVLETLAKMHPDPVARLLRFIDEHAAAATGDPGAVEAAQQLVNGRDEQGVALYVRERYGENVLAQQREQIARFCNESLFAALARGPSQP